MMKSYRYARGSAMTEFFVLAVIMVPAIAFIPMLAKVSDVNQSTIQAARYAAWERTVSDSSQKSDGQIATEVANRFYRDMDVMIETDGGVLADNPFENNYWGAGVDQNGDPISLVTVDGQNMFVNTTNQAIPSGTGANILSQGIATIGSVMGSLIPDASWDLEENGFYVAEVGVNVAANSILSTSDTPGHDCGGQQSTETFVCVSRRNAIFVDGWNSESPGQTRERVRSLVPAGALAPVGDFLSNLGYMPLFRELRRMDGMFGNVQEDVLPLDRYGEPD